jgi:excisionase family DNA binding protein
MTLAELIESGRAVCSVEEAAEVTEIGLRTAYDAVRSGQLPSVRLGRRILVPVPRLIAMLGAAVEGPT